MGLNDSEHVGDFFLRDFEILVQKRKKRKKGQEERMESLNEVGLLRHVAARVAEK